MECKENCAHLVTVHRMKKGEVRCAYCSKFNLWLKVQRAGNVKATKRCKEM